MAAQAIEVMDVVLVPGGVNNRWLILDSEGQIWDSDPDICMGVWEMPGVHPGASALDYYMGTSPGYGVVAFPNGDVQLIDDVGWPMGDLIPGPPGASGIEEVGIDDLGNILIRAGCVFWVRSGDIWIGPCEPFGAGASEAEAESWGKIKAEFKD
jgi:hypothetical protein